MPRMRSGWRAPRATSRMGSADVFVAMTASLDTTASRSAMTACFTLRSSKTASMTRSVVAMWSRHSLGSAVPTTAAAARAASASPSWRRFTLPANTPSIWARPRARPASDVSRNTTGKPLAADTVAMPAPMSPAPTTPTRCTGFLGAPTGLFFNAVCPLKMDTRARDSGVKPSEPKCVASASRPASKPPTRPASTTRRMARGAGIFPPVCFITCSRAFFRAKLRAGPTDVSTRST
mmetsp:Transcript_15288/g.47727  ORF Transcript_15288/g.47727 Transcript_15288/m.47727 type:complete len:235 (+) Transcript_15288:578-1282(+)